MCRACINELTKELITSKSEISLKEKDVEKIKTDLQLMDEKYNHLESESKELHNQIDNYRVTQCKFEELNDKHGQFELERKEYDEKIKALTNALESERFQVKTSTEEIAKLNEKMCEKETRLIEVQNKIGEYMNEINALQLKISGLNQVLAESGSGDLSRELASMQEKLSQIQQQYFQVVSEKQALSDQIDLCIAEKQALSDYNKTYYEHIKILQEDIDTLNASNLSLKEQLDQERSTVMALQNERIRHLEEKNLLGAIYQQLSEDVNRVEALEVIIDTMNKEANRLSVIAEYNKQIGIHLQNEVAERDKTIFDLQTNIDKLSSLHVEHSKDKEALSDELKQICHVKEQLNHRLELEIRKSETCSDYKREIDRLTEELKIMQEIQKSERIALKQLLEDFDNVTNQRDHLLETHNTHVEEIKNLTRSLEIGHEKYIKLSEDFAILKSQLQDSQHSFYEKEIYLIQYQKQLEDQYEFERNEMENLKKSFDHVEKRNLELDDRMQYMKNNMQKLSNELNIARESSIALEKNLNNETQEKQHISQQIRQKEQEITELCNEKNEMYAQLIELQEKHEKLSRVYEHLVNESNKCQKENTTELLASRELLKESTDKIEKLIITVNTAQETIEALQEEKRQLEMENEKIYDRLKQLEENTTIFEENTVEKETLLQQMCELEKKHSCCNDRVNALLQEVDILKLKLDESQRELENHSEFYKNCVEEMEKEYNEQKGLMKTDLQNLTSKIFDLSNELNMKDEAYVRLEKTQKDLASKLLNSVKICIDEKCARQIAENKMTGLEEQISILKCEASDFEDKINALRREQNELVNKLSMVNEENAKISSTFMSLQEEHQLLLERCKNYESEIKDLNQRCKKLSKIASETKIVIEDCAEYKELASKLKDYEKKLKILQDGIEDNHEVVVNLQQALAKSKNDYAILEFQKCEIVLRYHEAMGKLTAEQNINNSLHETHKKTVSSILQMRETGMIDRKVYETLLPIVMDSEPEPIF